MTARPRKRSLTLKGHATSVSLEEEFWDALREIAAARGQPVAALAGEIDRQRGMQTGLASAIRVFVLRQYRRAEGRDGTPAERRDDGHDGNPGGGPHAGRYAAQEDGPDGRRDGDGRGATGADHTDDRGGGRAAADRPSKTAPS